MKVKKITMFLILITVLFSLSVYGTGKDKMEMQGRITRVVLNGQGEMAEIMVDNLDISKKSFDKVVALITENTRIMEDNQESGELKVGQIVNILFSDSPRIMIYPARIEAETIKVVDYSFKQKKIMDVFYSLVKEKVGLGEVVQYVDVHISVLSRENASLIINELESLQKENLPGMNKRYNDSNIQREISNIYGRGFDLTRVNQIDKIKELGNQKLKELLLETRNSGYKVETAEGMFFPVIDYTLYKKYNSRVTPDIKEYIDIMARESDRVPAKDAALVIGWDEVIKRALSQERFIKQYPGSSKTAEVKELYRKYLIFTFYGLNNTPLFSYHSREMLADAKTSYMQIVKGDKDSELIEIMRAFMELLKANNYRLTDEVDRFRKGEKGGGIK